jgi:lathosterol oxidase
MFSPQLSDLVQLFAQIWPIIWAIEASRYLVAAGLLSAIIWAFWSAGLAARKVQGRTAGAHDVRREVLTSLRTAAIFSLSGFGIHLASLQGWVIVYTDFEQAGPGYLLGTVVLLILLHDTYFYWTHRLMHYRRFFRLFHLTHHKSRTPTPWAAYAFSIPEAVVQGAFTPIFVAFMPAHDLALFTFMAFQIVRNVMGHAGVELHPAGLVQSRWFGWNNTTTFHDLHHQTGRYNFGLYFGWWDRFMGTQHPDYVWRFEAVTSGIGHRVAEEREGAPPSKKMVQPPSVSSWQRPRSLSGLLQTTSVSSHADGHLSHP